MSAAAPRLLTSGLPQRAGFPVRCCVALGRRSLRRANGECPLGGLRVSGYITTAARYCAITGGRYTVVAKSGTPDEQGACALPGGKACAASSMPVR